MLSRCAMAALIPTLITLQACYPQTLSDAPAATRQTWQLSEIDGASFSARATLLIEAEGKVVGQAPCNRYLGQIEGSYPIFKLGRITTTKMACPELAAEALFLGALQTMTRAKLSDTTLLLSNASGTEMVFKAE